MKKHISIFLILALVFSIFYGSVGVAKAAGIEVKITPGTVEMTTAGSASLEVTVTNTTATDLPDGCVLKMDGASYGNPFGPIPVNEHETQTISVNVTDGMFGSSKTFQLHDAGGNAISGASAAVSFTKKALSVGIGGSFSISPAELAAAGDVVELKFTIENQGEAKLTNIVVKIPGVNGGKALNPEFTLIAKEKKSFSYNYTVTAAASLAPVVYYKVEGGTGETLQYAVAAKELKLETRDVEMTLTPSTTTPQPGADVTFTVGVVNNGNVPYTEVKLTMNGVELDVPSSKLNEGGKFTEEYTESFLASTDVTFELTMKDHKGEIVSISKSVSIELPVDDSVVASKLKMEVEVDRPTLTSAGAVTFSGYIQNGTDYTLTNLVVTEATSGAAVYNFALLASYASTSFEYPVNINETTTYNFQLTVTDTAGNPHTINAEPVTVTITSAQATPGYSDAAEVTPSGIPIDSNGGSGLGAVMVIAIILVVLIIGVGVALLLLYRAQKNGKGIGRASAKPSGTNPNGTKPNGTKPGMVKKRPAAGPVRRKGPVSRGYRDRNNF